MALFMPMYQEVSIDAVTLKYDNLEVGKQYCSPKDHGTRCAIGLLHVQ